MRPTGSLRRDDRGLLEIEVFGLSDTELAHFLHLRLQLWRRYLAFAVASLGFGGEVHDHGVAAVFVADPHAAEHVGTERCPLVSVLVHQLTGPYRIAALALHDLHEAGLIWIALKVDRDVGAVLERGVTVENLGCLGPPLILLRTVAVATCVIFGVEADHRDGPSVLGDPAGTAKPASRARRKVLHPRVESGVQRLRIGRLALDDLNEHTKPPMNGVGKMEMLFLGDVTTAVSQRQ